MARLSTSSSIARPLTLASAAFFVDSRRPVPMPAPSAGSLLLRCFGKLHAVSMSSRTYTTLASRGSKQPPPPVLSPADLQQMPMLALHEKILTFSRRMVDETSSSQLMPLIDEILSRQEISKSERLVRDAMMVAHLAGLHSRCLELFLTASRQDPGCVPLLEVVVNSAFAPLSVAAATGANFESHRSPEQAARLIVTLANTSADRFRKYASDSSTELAMLRIIWLCALYALEWDQYIFTMARKGEGGPGEGDGSHDDLTLVSKNLRAAAEVTFDHLSVYNSTFWSEVSANSHKTDGADRKKQNRIIFDRSSAISLDEQQQYVTFVDLWNVAQNCARFHYNTDGGESAFYWRCYQKLWIRYPYSTGSIVSLMKSTGRVEHVALLKRYFWDFFRECKAAHDAKAAAAEVAATQGADQQRHQENMQNSRTSTDADGEQDSRTQAELQEVVVHAYLQGLVNCRAFGDVVASAEELFKLKSASHESSADDASEHVWSHSVLSVICRAAGEVRRLDVATRCAYILFQRCSGGSVNLASPHASHRRPFSSALPSAYEVFICLMSLAKCGAPTFPSLLEVATANADISPTDEESLCLKLHYLRRSCSMKPDLDAILQQLDNKPMSSASLLSSRNMTLILIVMQTCDHPNFYSRLRDFCHRSTERKLLWLTIGFLWAENHRKELTEEQRKWMLRELRELHSKSPNVANRNTSALWHTIVSQINPAVGDATSQKGAAAVFLADCVVEKLLTPMEAFLTNQLQWPQEDNALRFPVRWCRGKCSESLRCPTTTKMEDAPQRGNHAMIGNHSSGLASSPAGLRRRLHDQLLSAELRSIQHSAS